MLESFRILNKYAHPGVYRIFNPTSGLSYVGGAVNIAQRVGNHRKRLKRGQHPNSRVQDLYDTEGFSGLLLEILEVCPRCPEAILEAEWRAYRRFEGKLLNGNKPTKITSFDQKPKTIDVTDSLQKSFDACVIKHEDTDKCWGWRVGAKRNHGYPELRDMKASRISYVMHYGVQPGSLIIRHICDNTECTNPKHLLLGTRKQNGEDYSLALKAKKKEKQ